MTDDALEREYEALRRGAGAHRLAVDGVSVRGLGANEYLQGQLSQDLAAVEVGGAAPALVLEPDGKLCALVRAVRTADDAWVVETEAGFGGEVAARLRRFLLRTRADVEEVDWPCVALRGAGVADLPGGAPATGPPWAVPVRWNGTVGVDLAGPGADGVVPAGVQWCGDAAWEALRVEAGIPKQGAELDDKTIAAEAGLVGRTVSFTKGCYTGQELVARLDARGNRVARRLCGVLAPDVGADEASVLVGAALRAPGSDKVVGRCTSASWCPGVGASAALGYLHRSVDVPADLEWAPGADGDGAQRRAARAVALPMVGG